MGDVVCSRRLEIRKSPRTGRPRIVENERGPVAVFREDGYLILEKEGLMLLKGVALMKKLVITDQAASFVAEGKDMFCKHLAEYTGKHYVGEDVIVISSDDVPLACGQLVILPREAKFFNRGVLVRTRIGSRLLSGAA
ncbi:MAG: PUA domain-containing protein [Thermoprotei archaeon]